MDGVESKSIRFLLPAFADEFVGCESAEGLESFGEVVSSDEVAEVSAELVVVIVVVALNCGLFEGAVHALDLAVGPGMIGLSEPMIDAMGKTDPVKRVATKASRWSLSILRLVGKLDAVVGEHGMDAIRNSRDQGLQEGRGCSHIRTLDHCHESKLGGAVDGYGEVEFAFRGAHFRQIDMKVADGIALELLSSRLPTFYFRQPADAMPFQTAMQRRAGQVRNRCLQSMEAVIEGQQSMPAEGKDDGLLLHRQNRGAGMLRAGAKIAHRAAFPPLGHRLRIDPMTAGQRSQALLTMLYRSTDRLCRGGAPV
jgi:hypothetical protein